MIIHRLQTIPSNLTLNSYEYQHPLFKILIAEKEGSIYWASLHPLDQEIDHKVIHEKYSLANLNPITEIPAWLTENIENFLNNKACTKDFSVTISGTDFQFAVWEKLVQIPYGHKVSYQDIAVNMNKPKAVRAVATAIGANPISLFIPCHRVVGKDQKLRGYRWGLPIKKALLALEA